MRRNLPRIPRLRAGYLGLGVAALFLVVCVSWLAPQPARSSDAAAEPQPTASEGAAVFRIRLEQQQAVALRTARAEVRTVPDVLHAPGRVAPDESRYAFVTPRAAGVVRAVNAQIGQDV